MNFFLETYGFTYLLCSKRYIKEELGFLTETDKTKNKEYVKRFWVRQLYQEHKLNVELNLLVHNMKLYDSKPFFWYFGVSVEKLETLLYWVAPLIAKKEPKSRQQIRKRKILCITMTRVILDQNCIWFLGASKLFLLKSNFLPVQTPKKIISELKLFTTHSKENSQLFRIYIHRRAFNK